MIIQKRITLQKSDGRKNLSELLSTTQVITYVKLSSGDFQVGGSDLDVDSNPGIVLNNGFELRADCRDDLVNTLYLQSTAVSGNTLIVFAF